MKFICALAPPSFAACSSWGASMNNLFCVCETFCFEGSVFGCAIPSVGIFLGRELRVSSERPERASSSHVTKRGMPPCSHLIAEPAVDKAPVITRSGRSLDKLRVFVGFDVREEVAYEVCRHSLLKHATASLEIIPLKLPNLTNQGLYTRTRDPTESTEFSFTRFLTPFLAGFDGWAMFVDCDFLYTADVRELAELIDEQYAVMCVHHDYAPTTTVKMDGALQTCYPRKNWSSMVLYNCAHPKNKVLTPALVNSASGAFLHRFMWLEDADIGELPSSWNFLVGHNELPKSGEAPTLPKAIHFTSGGPWFEAWKDCEFADEWRKARDAFWNSQQGLQGA